MTDEEVDAIEALWLATTTGPWVSYVEGRNNQSGSNFIMTAGEDIELLGATVADQDFIACAHQNMPRLVNEVRRLRQLLGITPQSRGPNKTVAAA